MAGTGFCSLGEGVVGSEDRMCWSTTTHRKAALRPHRQHESLAL